MKCTFTLCVTLLSVMGCTTQLGYQTAQNWQRGECNKMLDQSERSSCMSKANVGYDEYKRESEQIQRRP